MDLFPIGISGRLFYYMSGGEDSAFDICFRFKLCDPPDRDLLRQAAGQALANFPEFAFRPVIHRNTVWGEPSTAPPPLLEDDGRVLHYGTEETGGYLFALRCTEDGFSLSYFHGLTDFHGVWSFIHTLLYYYAPGKRAKPFADPLVRLDDSAARRMDAVERLDPYLKFLPEKSAPPPTEDQASVFALPAAATIQPTCYEICCPLKDFLLSARAQETSAAALIALLASHTISRLYKTKGKVIRTMLSANMRRYYGTETLSNFSDAVFMDFDDRLRELPLPEQGRIFKQNIRSQLNREHFDRLIASKVRLVQEMVDSGLPLATWNERFAAPPDPEKPAPLTIPLTYPGSFDLPAEYQSIVCGISRSIDCAPGVFGLSGTSYGDTLRLDFVQRFASSALAEGVLSGLQALGVKGNLQKLPSYTGNRLVPSRLLQMQ